MERKQLFRLIIIPLVSINGCTSYSKIDNPYDPRIRNSSLILVECGDAESYLLQRVTVQSEVMLGKGMKHNRESDQWKHFDGSIPIYSISGIYVRQLDVERTMKATVLVLGYFLAAVGLNTFWSGPRRYRRLIRRQNSSSMFRK